MRQTIPQVQMIKLPPDPLITSFEVCIITHEDSYLSDKNE